VSSNTANYGLVKQNENENVDIDLLNANLDKIDAKARVLWVNDGYIPPATDLYHGRIVRELTSGKVFTAQSNGQGGFNLIPSRGDDAIHRFTGAPLVGDTPPAGAKFICHHINAVATLVNSGAVIPFTEAFPNGVLTVEITNGDVVARPGVMVGLNFINVNGFGFNGYLNSTTGAPNGPLRITGTVWGW
jgi:hypothetical protein